MAIDEKKSAEDNEYINLKLTKNESLVFYEFLARLNNQNKKDIFEDQAEERVLWDLQCIFEKELSEPFCTDYMKKLQNARDAVRDDIE
jgi:hypothetical protein